jgi:hypothetical protein
MKMFTIVTVRTKNDKNGNVRRMFLATSNEDGELCGSWEDDGSGKSGSVPVEVLNESVGMAGDTGGDIKVSPREYRWWLAYGKRLLKRAD